jgi:predicted metal-dependent peptidase
VASYGSLGWKEIYDLLKQDQRNRPSCLDVHTHGDRPPAQLEQAHKAAQGLAQAARQAMQAIKNRAQAGLTRPESQLSTENGEAAPLDWRNQLRDYLQSFTVTGGQHWRSIELRPFLSFGTYSPKRTEEDHRLQKVRLLLDTSGSMAGDVANAVKDAARVLSQVGCCDAHLRFYGSGLLPDKVTLVEDSTVVKDLALETSVPGGGGTSVISALDELAQELDAIHFDGLTVAFTDGQDDLDVSACTIKPDVWVIYGSESQTSRPSHGLAIYIEV